MMVESSLVESSLVVSALVVSAQHAENPALDGDLGGFDEDGLHLDVRRLQADLGAFVVEALEGGFGPVHQSDDDLPLAGGAGDPGRRPLGFAGRSPKQ